MRYLSLLIAGILIACTPSAPEPSQAPVAPVALAARQADAVFAGGCFWCMEPPFEALDGVVSVTSGYAGGAEVNPTYDDVANGRTGHAEVVRVVYDSTRISYAELLAVFWRNIDPLVADRQFCDVGAQYRSAIFYGNDAERQLAEQTKAQHAERFGQPVLTQIVPDAPFYPAEEYHQDFYKKNPTRYYSYRQGCRRDARLRQLWGDEAGG